MECSRARRALEPFADAALSAPRRWLLSRHLSGCAGCAAHLEAILAMRHALRATLPYHHAPAALATRIGGALRTETTGAAVPPPRADWWRLPATGLAGALAGVALLLLVQHDVGRRPDDTLTSDLLASHIRSLMPDHLTDVLTSDRHTVKPWLSAHVDVSPPVRDLAAEGFPLIGGRLDYIDGHPAAVVVYRRDRHIINLFAWPSVRPDAAPRAGSRQGFNLIGWRSGGIEFAAVSDLEAGELADFVSDIRAAPR